MRHGVAAVTPHRIRVKANVKPVFKRPYRQPIRLEAVIKKMIENMLEEDVIEEGDSDCASSYLLVNRKQEDEYRFVVDFRELNKRTEPDNYPLPSVDELFESMQGAKYFTTLDLKSGYWLIPTDENDRHYTAFLTKWGQFQFKVLPFGLKNAPPTFQKIMEKALIGLKHVQIFLDDIIVYGKDKKERVQSLDEVLKKLVQMNLKINLNKCHVR